jgi:polysaccharide chain length determinant protein (PEP-CTERM system associated)
MEIWRRRKWVAVLVFCSVFAAVVSLTVWLPDVYRATATVLVQTQQVSEAFVQPLVTAELDTRIELIRQEIMSRARLGELIRRFDLYPEPRKEGMPFDAIIEQARRDIKLELKGVEPLSGRSPTIAFAISYTGRDPQVVAQVANVLASSYVEENTRIREGQAVRTAEFLKAQLADVKKELDAQDQRSSEFKLSHIGELPQQVEANLASLERLNTQLRLNSESQIRAMDRRERLERQLTDAESAAVVVVAPARSPAEEQLAKLKHELDELRRQFSDQYPDVIRVRAEVATLERQIAQSATPSSTAPPMDPKPRLKQAIGEVDTELRALKGEELSLRQAVASYEQRIENVPKRQEEIQALSGGYDTTKERYDALLKRYEEARLAENLEQGQKLEQLRILDPAIPPHNPAAPSRRRLFALGFILAIGLAVLAVLAAEKFDTSFHSIDDLRGYINIPTLFSIPLIQTTTARRKRRRRSALVAASVAVGLALIVVGSRYLASGNEQIARLMLR